MVFYRDDSQDDRFYDTPVGRFPSVTTLLEHGVPKPALMYWSASETAKAALDNLPRLLRARTEEQRKEVLTYLRKASTRKRDAAAELGSAVHAAADAHVLGTPHPDPTEEQAPFIDAFHRFEREFKPGWVATELILVNEEIGYAGAADFFAHMTLDGQRTLVIGDYKTGKNVYPEVSMQLCAYANAKHAYLPNTGEEVEVPQAEAGVVVHLRPDKWVKVPYRVFPVDIGDDVLDAFKAVTCVADFDMRMSKTMVGKALDPAA